MYRSLAVATKYSASPRARLESLAREQTEAAINTIISIMNEPTVDPRTRLTAADMLLNRGWGQPKETLVTEGAESRGLMKIVREIVHVNETQETIDGDDGLVVEYSEIRSINGNGSNGHDQQ